MFSLKRRSSKPVESSRVILPAGIPPRVSVPGHGIESAPRYSTYVNSGVAPYRYTPSLSHIPARNA